MPGWVRLNPTKAQLPGTISKVDEIHPSLFIVCAQFTGWINVALQKVRANTWKLRVCWPIPPEKMSEMRETKAHLLLLI